MLLESALKIRVYFVLFDYAFFFMLAFQTLNTFYGKEVYLT